MLVLPPVIGHRGACAHAPENTLASFAKAADLGCRMVEFDVRLSADGVPVVFHDDNLERCTAGRGPVRAHTLAQLARLGVATLDEVLALCHARNLAVNIEVKPDPGTGAATTRAALDLAGKVWHGPAPLVSSFDPEALAAARNIRPDWPRGLLFERVPADWPRLAELYRASAIHAHHRALPAPLVAAIKARGLAVLAYTVNRPGRAKTLWRRGVDAVFCDAPDRLLS